MSDTPDWTKQPTLKEKWDMRYGQHSEYVYGTEPNDFLSEASRGLPPGDVLCLADGEGRNGVFLAGLGHRVTAVDLAAAGIAKAEALAAQKGVDITTIVADLADYALGESRWDLIVSIFAHTPPPVRVRLHGLMARALRPGGKLILEAYTPDQCGRGTGGPPTPEGTMTLADLRTELVDLNIEHGLELVRSVVEGPGHTGDGAVVQVICTCTRPEAEATVA